MYYTLVMQASLFQKYQVPLVKSRDTERGNLMKELMENLNVTRKGKFAPLSMPRMGSILEKIPTDSLYALISKCKDSGNRNKEKYFEAYSKTFWWEIRPHGK